MAQLGPVIGPYIGGGVVGAVLVTLVRAVVQAFKISTDSDGHRDGLQATRISELERRFDAERKHCDERIERLNVRIVVVAQSTMELSSVVEHHDPSSPALARARLALQHAFPLNFDIPADMASAARKLGEKE